MAGSSDVPASAPQLSDFRGHEDAALVVATRNEPDLRKTGVDDVNPWAEQ
ncbi:MAG: hypothetical protein R2722_06405 [Tessaracoccus sp.]